MGIFDRFRGRRSADVEPQPEPRRHTRKALPRITLRGYEAAQGGRLNESWPKHPESPVTIVEREWRALCARGRDAQVNMDHGKKFLRLVRKNIVGAAGVQVIPAVLKPDGTVDDLACKAISEAWKEWGLMPEVTETLTWRELQGLVVQTVARDGECFVRILKGRDYGKYRIQLQLIDPTRVDVSLREDLRNGNRIRAGIEFTPEGKRVAFYIRVDAEDYAEGFSYSGAKYQRVPASEMIHLFLPEFIGQPRGLSWMGTALTRLHHLSRYETAAVINARVGATKSGFFQADPDYVDVTGDDEEELDFPESAEPGSFDVLPVGYSFKEYNPQYPQGEFETFTRACLTSVAAGLDVSYSALTGDLSKANYSSLRAGALDERETWKDLQQWFVDKLIRPVFEAWVSVAVLAGAITIGLTPLRVERVGQYKRARFQPRRWAWVDPAKDANAHRTEQDGLMRSVSESIRESGRDPDEVFDEIAEERRKWGALGIAQAATKAAPIIEEVPDDAGNDETDEG